MRIRPLVVYEEELYIGKVATYIFEGKGGIERKKLQMYRAALERRRQSLFSIKIKGEEYTMYDFMCLHLYGKFFQLEKKKRKILMKYEKSFGALTEATSLGNLEIYATIAFCLAEDIKAIRAGNLTDLQPINISLVR